MSQASRYSQNPSREDNNLMPLDRQSEIRSLTKRKSSVKDITAKFTGSSLPETEQAFQAKIRKGKTVPSATPNELSNFTLLEKKRFMKEWAIAIRSRDSGEETTMQSGEEFLRSHCLVTKEKCQSEESWNEWVEAIQEVVRAGSPVDERLDKSPIKFKTYQSISPPRSSIKLLSSCSSMSSKDLNMTTESGRKPPGKVDMDDDDVGDLSGGIEDSSEVDQWLSVRSIKDQLEESSYKAVDNQRSAHKRCEEKSGHDTLPPIHSDSSKILGGHITVRKAPRKINHTKDSDGDESGSGEDKENFSAAQTDSNRSNNALKIIKPELTSQRSSSVRQAIEQEDDETPPAITTGSSNDQEGVAIDTTDTTDCVTRAEDEEDKDIDDHESSGILSPDTPENALLTDRWSSPDISSPTEACNSSKADISTAVSSTPSKSKQKTQKAKNSSSFSWTIALSSVLVLLIAITAVYFTSMGGKPAAIAAPSAVFTPSVDNKPVIPNITIELVELAPHTSHLNTIKEEEVIEQDQLDKIHQEVKEFDKSYTTDALKSTSFPNRKKGIINRVTSAVERIFKKFNKKKISTV